MSIPIPANPMLGATDPTGLLSNGITVDPTSPPPTPEESPLGLPATAPDLNSLNYIPPVSSLGGDTSGQFSATDEEFCSFAGSDIQVMLQMPNSDLPAVKLIQIVTLTVSVHREKAPVRAIGYINPKAYARGRRTIAGTIILTQSNVDFLYQFLAAISTQDLSKDTTSYKIDQLPPFNMSILFADEYGRTSYRRLLGVELITDGVVYSSNDMMSEQSLTYVASDFTPLVPLNKTAILSQLNSHQMGPNPLQPLPENPISNVIQQRQSTTIEQDPSGDLYNG